jgi:hypothetical protein
VSPNTKALDTDDVRQAKADALAKRAHAIRTKGSGFANTLVVLDAIRSVFSGNLGELGTDIAVRATYGAGKQALANLLEKPGVVKFLTEPTARDIAQIPPEMRGNIGQLAEAAKAKGIPVSPELLAAVGGIVGPQTQKLRQLQNGNQPPAQ